MSDGSGRNGAATIGRIEVPAADPEASARFFAEAFGWRSERVEWEGGHYLSLAPPSGPGAGVTSAETLGAAAPLAVIHVEGPPLEEWLERIAAAGGLVDRGPQEVGGFGRFARFRDPEGHLYGLWSAKRRHERDR
jgi:hypothetical protein